MTDKPPDFTTTGSMPSAVHHITGFVPHRYAMQIDGLDAEGRPRCLVLTWDGVWHPASPTTGNLMRRADTFDDGERARHNGAIVTRRGYAVLTTDPPRTIWIDENNTTTYIFAHDLVEVLP